ncbi:ankyrin repeat, SAM and basic leucine zipper domain-containing protein 1-like [Dermacentor andersoni]|uniref:ankyrin repeat, SAM and basic leucine zipper domain-containing protein 1-like n=1 Tax=Dermacentor andersoni TaxID=34620 RepID=UPI0021555598|nr:ankyrin repeat, SAM and basic leucine zipper domain-containing protein 1-like [Dermacentor andersoni]
MAGIPADYLEWSESDDDEIVFGDDYCPDDMPKLLEAPVPALCDVKKLEKDEEISVVPRTSPELQEDFRVAVTRGNVELARNLIAQGLNVNREYRCNWSALVQAGYSGCAEMVQLLIDHGADVNAAKGFATPLMAVCGSQKGTEAALVTCAEVLLKHGADPDLADRDGVTPLMLAAREGYCQLIELLLDRGVDAKRLDSQGWTSLSWAAFAGQGRAARFLLMKVPFDMISLVTLDGQMPSDLALSQGYHKLSQILSKFETECRQKRNDGDAPSLDSAEPWTISQSTRKYRDAFGDVALVLAAIGAEERLPLFQEHGVTFQEMLNLDEEALCKMGIESEEERAKIIAGVESTRRFQIVSSSSGVNVDYALESFLSAVDTVELGDTLREHGVSTLDTLLKLDEEGLERAGITQVGSRARLAAAIRRAHQLPWHKSSVPDFRKASTITCPEAVSVVSTLRQHLGHLEVSVSHLGNHLTKRPQDLQLGRDLCSTRHLRKELREAHEALCSLAMQMRKLDQLAAKVEGCVEYQPQWPPLPAKVKRSKHLVWLPLCLLFTTLWTCKFVGRLGHWPLLPGWSLHRTV